jgi:hypothetical protein
MIIIIISDLAAPSAPAAAPSESESATRIMIPSEPLSLKAKASQPLARCSPGLTGPSRRYQRTRTRTRSDRHPGPARALAHGHGRRYRWAGRSWHSGPDRIRRGSEVATALVAACGSELLTQWRVHTTIRNVYGHGLFRLRSSIHTAATARADLHQLPSAPRADLERSQKTSAALRTVMILRNVRSSWSRRGPGPAQAVTA